MKWKITLRFMLAVLVVIVVSNLLNIIISMYFSYEAFSITRSFNGIISAVNLGGQSNTASYEDIVVTVQVDGKDMQFKSFNEQNDTLNFVIKSDDSGEEMVAISRSLIETVTGKNGWLQVIDSSGREIGSFNKPLEVKTNYTTSEIEWASVNPVKIKKYYFHMIPDVPTGHPNSKVRLTYVIGIPQPAIDLKNVIDFNLDYFRVGDTPIVRSLIITLIIALVLGYMFAVRLNRPVVRMTDCITVMADGNYDLDFPKDSFYKDVFKCLEKMSKSLKTAEQERKKLECMREEWITNISHDLKTPLSSIRGYGELLYENGGDFSEDDLRKYIQVVLDKSAYMDALINDLKLTLRLRNENFPMKKEKGNLAELLREVVIDILNDPRYEGRVLHFECEAEDLMLEFDPHLFRRAFTNLVMNAVVHNPEDTEIWVRARRDEKMIVEICDNGNGISSSEQEMLFHRYYRGTSTNVSHDGSGLGLAIAREIIEAHSGRIELESEPGKGTIIRVQL